MLRAVSDAVHLHPDVLTLHAPSETDRIITHLQTSVHQEWRLKGAVVGLSGGIDSSVVLALCVRSFGPERVVALMLPERESDPVNLVLARAVARYYGVTPIEEDISDVLEGVGWYRRRDDAIRRVFPEYGTGYEYKISRSREPRSGQTPAALVLTIVGPGGNQRKERLRSAEYRMIVAAMQFKHRIRMSILHYHAEVRSFAVIGATNMSELQQALPVYSGPGHVEVAPIAHLYKTQVMQLADYLNIPEEIRQRYIAAAIFGRGMSGDRALFQLPFSTMDLLSYAREYGISSDEAASASGLTPQEVEQVYEQLEGTSRETEGRNTSTLTL